MRFGVDSGPMKTIFFLCVALAISGRAYEFQLSEAEILIFSQEMDASVEVYSSEGVEAFRSLVQRVDEHASLAHEYVGLMNVTLNAQALNCSEDFVKDLVLFLKRNAKTVRFTLGWDFTCQDIPCVGENQSNPLCASLGLRRLGSQ